VLSGIFVFYTISHSLQQLIVAILFGTAVALLFQFPSVSQFILNSTYRQVMKNSCSFEFFKKFC
jgi:hypothetical protein